MYISDRPAMFADKARILLILPQEVVDRARVFAGQAMTKLKGPVSLQMVLRALIDEGLKRDRDRTILANITEQVRTVRELRSQVRRSASGRRPPESKVRTARRAPR